MKLNERIKKRENLFSLRYSIQSRWGWVTKSKMAFEVQSDSKIATSSTRMFQANTFACLLVLGIGINSILFVRDSSADLELYHVFLVLIMGVGLLAMLLTKGDHAVGFAPPVAPGGEQQKQDGSPTKNTTSEADMSDSNASDQGEILTGRTRSFAEKVFELHG